MTTDWQMMLTSALDGDDDAFERLRNEWLAPKIFAQALKHLRNRQDAEDVRQEMLAKLHFTRERIKTRELPAFEAYVVISVKRRCIDKQRKAKPEVPLLEAGEGPEPAADTDVLREVELRQLREDIERAMEEELNEDERSLVAKRIFLEYSFRKISEKFGIPLTTLHSRYQKALEKLGKNRRLREYLETERSFAHYDN